MSIHLVTALFILLFIVTGFQVVYWSRYQKVLTFILNQSNIDLDKLHAANDPEFSPVLYAEDKEFDVCGKTLFEAVQEVERYYCQMIIPSVRIFLTHNTLASHISRGEHMRIILDAMKQMDQARAKVLRKYPKDDVLTWRDSQNQYPVKEQ